MYKFSLVGGRHDHKTIKQLPALFETMLAPDQVFDYSYHQKILHERLRNIHKPIAVYVTGLTPLLVSVINYCRWLNKPLTLYHFDKHTHTYRAQTVV